MEDFRSYLNYNFVVFSICANNPDFISPDFHTVKRFTTEGNRAMIQLYSRRNQARLKVAFRYVTDTNEATIPDTCRPRKSSSVLTDFGSIEKKNTEIKTAEFSVHHEYGLLNSQAYLINYDFSRKLHR